MAPLTLSEHSKQSSEFQHILIVDADATIRTQLSNVVKKSGYRASAVGDSAAMHRALEQASINLVVLDTTLCGEDAFRLCRFLRETPIAVLILTASGDDMSRIALLDAGADDYVAKPFNPRELIARIKAVLRRTSHVRSRTTDAPQYRFGNWYFNTATRELTHNGGSTVKLRGAEFSLLNVLIAHAGQVFSRAELTRILRGRNLDPFDRSTDMRISRLRQLLRDDARSPEIIRTVYGGGYLVGVPVERIPRTSQADGDVRS